MNIDETTYRNLWIEIKQDLLLILSITRDELKNIEYIITLNEETKKIKTLVQDRYETVYDLLAPKDKVIVTVNNQTIPKELLYAVDYDDFAVGWLKHDDINLYNTVVGDENEFDGLVLSFTYSALDHILTREYEYYCKNQFIYEKLDEFVTDFLEKALKKHEYLEQLDLEDLPF